MERKLQKVTLDNRLRILLERDEKMRSCSLGVWIASGSGYENAASMGHSHFMEHMLFKGTPTRSAQDIAEQMDAIGGVLNAYTAKEYTCIYARALSDHVDKAFSVIADMVTNPRLCETDIETEKGIIAEEIAMYEDSPEDLCMDLFYEHVWPDSAFGRNILGTRTSVAATRLDSLCTHLQRYYRPSRMVVSFCGNFDTDRALALCEEYFGTVQDAPDELCPAEIRYQPAVHLLEKDIEQNQVILGFPGVSADDERKYAVQLFSTLLGGASSSRLFRRIREELGLVYSIDSFHVPHLTGGLFGIAMGVSPDAQEQALAESCKILQSFNAGVSEDELARAKEQAIAGMIMSFESSAARVSHAGRSELLHGRIHSEDEIIANIRAVTLDELRDTAALVTDPAQASFCVVGQELRDENFYRSLF